MFFITVFVIAGEKIVCEDYELTEIIFILPVRIARIINI